MQAIYRISFNAEDLHYVLYHDGRLSTETTNVRRYIDEQMEAKGHDLNALASNTMAAAQSKVDLSQKNL